jgi:LuxR family maltose regulon positive regulatory protein
VAARFARKRDDIAEARVLLAKAAGLRPRLNRTFPGISVQTHIELARAYLDMSDVAGARTVLRDARAIVYGGVDLGVLPAELDEIGQGISQMAPARVGPSALSTAELRLLPLLATHLTFPEIGERLYISRHTVKAQARSIYRKLGASKRSEAVQSARELGFLEG